MCARNCYGQSALHIAARRGDLAPIELLLAANADANALDEQVAVPTGPTPQPAATEFKPTRAMRRAASLLWADGRAAAAVACSDRWRERSVRLAERVARCMLLARAHANAHAHLRAAADPPRRSGAVHPRARRRAACAAHACPWAACGGALRPGASAVGSPRPTVARKSPVWLRLKC